MVFGSENLLLLREDFEMMKRGMFIFVTIVVLFGLARVASAEGRDERNDRQKFGKPVNMPRREMGNPVGHNRIVFHGDGHEILHAVIGDHRPMTAIHNDSNIVRLRPGVFGPGHIEHRWDHWHRDWGLYWRFTTWNRISQITCEAVNTANNYLYPVTGFRSDWPTGWSNDAANVLIETAMDHCYSESEAIGANPAYCAPVEWECRPTYF